MAAVTGKVIATRRAGTSGMGNPKWDVCIQHESGYAEIYTTAPNGSLAYVIANPEFRTTEHTFQRDARNRLTRVVDRVNA